MRIAIVNKELCKPNRCSLECAKVCPRNRAGDKCIIIEKMAVIDESICIGCGLCSKKCPFKAIQIVNTPEQLKENPIHRFGANQFVIFRLPFTVKGEIVGLLGQNGVGKTTAMKILSGEIKPNFGGEEEKDYIKKLITLFRGTELQNYLELLEKGNIKTVYKPQQIDILSKVDSSAKDILEKYDERGIKEKIIEDLQLKNCLNQKLNQLSGGELQRLAMAITAMRKADIYYIDEPSSYLDVYQRLSVAKLIRELSKEASVMVVEHDLATLDFLADKIHVFYGAPGAYGIVSKPYSVRTGINAFLDGYIKEDNVRIHEPINFLLASMPLERKEILLEFGNIIKKYPNFSLSIEKGKICKGEILAVFGANALGKTTFAKILAGVENQDSGDISRKIKISYKPQYIGSDFKGTVSELLQTAADVYSDEFKTSIAKPLQLENIMESAVAKLSGGELQRASIALCLSKDYELLLLDEPSAFLDSQQRLAVAKLIRRTCEQKQCSAMIIDHDLLFLSYIGDRAMLFSGEPGKKGEALQCELKEGFNIFLKNLEITFRKEPETGRPRANKFDSQKDAEQKESGKYFLG